LHSLQPPGDADWTALHETYEVLCQFYNAVGFAKLITLAIEAATDHPELIGHRFWIIDEFQDFNRSEEQLIRTLTESALGVLLAGDDEQALYQTLKAGLPEIIISYYTEDTFVNAMLPFCSRCSYHVCLAASEFIGATRAGDDIGKIYLPLVVDESAPLVHIVGTVAPVSAVDYVRKFLEDHRDALVAHEASMAAGETTDPFLLILTPAKNLNFFRTNSAKEQLLELLARWKPVFTRRSADYRKLISYARAGWDGSDNFSFRQVLHHEGLTADEVHPWIVDAIESARALSEVDAERVAAGRSKCAESLEILADNDLDTIAKVDALHAIVNFGSRAALVPELQAHPIGIPPGAPDEEAEETIDSVGALAAVEFMSIIGSKGLSAQHVIMIGCDNVNLAMTSRLAFFVGITRPRESLHLLVSMKAAGGTAAHDFVLGLPEDHCRYGTYTKTDQEFMTLEDRDAFIRQLAYWYAMATRRRR
jgi:hypothetical protein